MYVDAKLASITAAPTLCDSIAAEFLGRGQRGLNVVNTSPFLLQASR